MSRARSASGRRGREWGPAPTAPPGVSPCARPPPTDDSGPRSGDLGLDRPLRGHGGPGGLPRPRGAHAALPAPGLGRARSRRDLGDHRRRRARRARGARRRRAHDRRDRDHQPAGDDDRLGSGHGSSHPPGHRVAVPAYRRALRAAPGGRGRADGPGANGARARCLLLRDEDPLATRRGVRGARARPARRAGVRHRRHVAPVEPHRGPRPRDRPL